MMTIAIKLPADVEAQLHDELEQQGISTDTFIQEAVERSLQRLKNQRAIALLRSWVEEGDEEEQRETFEALKQGLNANHSSGRVIFP